MLKKLISAATIALMAGGLSAQSFSNTNATASWAVGNESEATVNDEASGAIKLSKVTVGSDLQITSTNATYTFAAEGKVGPYVTYLPSTSNPGCVATDMVEYTVEVKKGLTFTLSSVSFDLVKEGTDGAYITWSYTVDDVEGARVAYDSPKTQIRRNNDANPSAPLTHLEEISGATAGQKVTLRLYVSNVANNKKMSMGNIKINGTVNGEVVQRTFKDFKIDFRTDPYTVVAPEAGLPTGVEVTAGTFHDTQHGYSGAVVKLNADGPVKFIVGGCGYSNKAVVKDASGNVLTEIDTKAAGCDNGFGTYAHSASWTYNSETAQELTIELGSYCPYLEVKACDLIPMRTVSYYDYDGKTLVGKEEVEGGSPLAYKYGEADLSIIPECYMFRGWFNSTQASALKVPEGTSVQENLSLYPKATKIEMPSPGEIFSYPLNSPSFYIEDHEAISSTGSFHDTQHGYGFSAGQNIALQVAGNAVITLGSCKYTNAETKITVTDEAGNQIGEPLNAQVENDGANVTITYLGERTVLTLTFSGTAYVHNVTVYNVESIPSKNQYGYYEIASGDAASLQLVIAALQEGDKIFLPNGTYDFGEKALTTISANNVSIIGESMDYTIIRNAPDKSTEGIGTTATLLNTSNGLYLQDLTIQNALDYYGSASAGRAVCLQDKGANTICKNVKMLSYQDTYYSNKASNFYWEDSEIHGTVDYLCGDGNVVYNRVKLVNESRSANGSTGETTVCAPYNTATTEARYNWGYVFMNCTIETLSSTFNLGRSWGGESKATYLNTTINQPSKLIAKRFTPAGMNVAAAAFKEYKSVDPQGNILTPSSNIVNFTHSSGNKEYETVLTDEEAAQFTLANIYGEWAPNQTAAQVTRLDAAGASATYLVEGHITATLPTEGTVRVANGRGGFGPEIDVTTGTSLKRVQSATSSSDGKQFCNGKLVIVKNGQTFNAAGIQIK